MKQTRIMLFLLAFLALVTEAVSAVEVARDGRAQLKIAISEEPDRLEKMALADLQEFLKRMTGASFESIHETQLQAGEPAIYLGWTKFAGKQGIDCAKLGKEEWVVRSVGDSLVITGGRPVGTFYAVWRFLNRLGCYAMAMETYSLPKHPTLMVEALDIQGKPSFDGRLIYNDFIGPAIQGGMPKDLQEQYRLFAFRSGTNGLQSALQKQYHYGDIFNISTMPFQHTLCLYVSPKKYFQEHPEYFSMNADGKRVKPKGGAIGSRGSLCMSNREVWNITLESLRGFIQKDRKERAKEDWPVVYDISILDNTPYICKCPECTAISKEEGSEAGLLFRYINHVATEIAKEYPEIIIRTFAYSATRIPPKITKPAKNVLLNVCDEFGTADAFRPLTHPLNVQNLAAAKKWATVGNMFLFYDYWNIHNGFFDPPRWETVLDAIQTDLRIFQGLGGRGMFVEYERDLVNPQPFYDLVYFVGSQLLMDVNEDVEALVDAFLPAYYGSAAPVMKRLLQEMRQGVKEQPTRQTIHNAGNWKYFTPAYALSCYRAMKDAAAGLQAGCVERQHVENELLTLIWCVLARQASFMPTFQAAGIQREALVAECEAFAKQHIERICPTKPKRFWKQFHAKFDKHKIVLPRPKKFAGVADENFRLVAYPQAKTYKRLHSSLVDDPDSITRKAILSLGPKDSENHHGIGKMIQATPTIKVPNLKFALGNIGSPRYIHPGTRWEINTVLGKVHQDEKYHWYKLKGKIDLQSSSYFWGHAWAIQFVTDSLYLLTDGIADNNVWEAWFSAKFTGPAYVPGSTKENAIWTDMVAFVRPGAPGVSTEDDELLSSLDKPSVKPSEFASVPNEAIRFYDFRAARPIREYRSTVVEDRESPTGKALRTLGGENCRHGFSDMQFSVSGAAGEVTMPIRGIEDNFENYHWFRMPKAVQITRDSFFQGFNGAVQFHPKDLYQANGGAEANTWEVWFSAKFTGPAYNPASVQQDAVWLDQLVFVKPGKMK